jgi:hypothetical protein
MEARMHIRQKEIIMEVVDILQYGRVSYHDLPVRERLLLVRHLIPKARP